MLLTNGNKHGNVEQSSLDKATVYTSGDLILFNNYRNVGIVLRIQPDSLTVLTANNQV